MSLFVLLQGDSDEDYEATFLSSQPIASPNERRVVSRFRGSQDGASLQPELQNYPASQSYSSEVRFRANTTRIKHLAEMFSTIPDLSPQCLIIINSDGVMLIAETPSRVCNATIALDQALFSTYTLEPVTESMKLQVDSQLVAQAFASVPDTLNPDLTCTISYDGLGWPLVVEFNDLLISERLEFATYVIDVSDPASLISVDRHHTHFEIMLNLAIFTTCLQDLHHLQTSEVALNISNTPSTDIRQQVTGGDHNSLYFVSKGPIGLSKVIYPGLSTILERVDIFDHDSDEDPLQSSTQQLIKSRVRSLYLFSHLARVIKAVKLSSKCKLVKDYRGVLLIQLLCRHQSQSTVVTFNIVEQLADDADDELVYHDEDEILTWHKPTSPRPAEPEEMAPSLSLAPITSEGVQLFDEPLFL